MNTTSMIARMITIAACSLAAAGALERHAEGPRVKVTFEESQDLFANPGMGWQTFRHEE